MASTSRTAVSNPTLNSEGGGAAGQPFAEIKTYHSHLSMCVNKGDLLRLEPGRWLNNHIINYVIWTTNNCYYETRLMKPVEICFLPTLVWADYKTHGVYRPRTTIHPFLSTFVVIPMNIDDSHWIVVILAYCKHNLVISDDDDNHRKPVGIFVLDSLRTAKHDEEFKADVLAFLDVVGAAQAGFQPHLLGAVPFHWPDDIPKQDNEVDCGLFCLQYISSFTRGPHEFVAESRFLVRDTLLDQDEFLGDEGREYIRGLLQISADLNDRAVAWRIHLANTGGNGASGSEPILQR